MMDAVFDEKMLVETVKRLSPTDQQRVIDFANQLARPKGTPGKVFVERTRDLHIEPDDIRRMTDAINEAFEQVEDFPEVNFDE